MRSCFYSINDKADLKSYASELIRMSCHFEGICVGAQLNQVLRAGGLFPRLCRRDQHDKVAILGGVVALLMNGNIFRAVWPKNRVSSIYCHFDRMITNTVMEYWLVILVNSRAVSITDYCMGCCYCPSAYHLCCRE